MCTPKQKITLIILAVLFWFAAPFVEAVYYYVELSRGAYPTNADSIAIPIAQFFIVWLIFSPFVALFIWWALRPYVGSVPFFAFNRQLKILGGLSWVATVAWLSSSIMFVLQSANVTHWVDVASGLFGCYLALCFNGVLQARGHDIPPLTRQMQLTPKSGATDL